MQLKFCVNLNKILEVIRFLLMTFFFVSPCMSRLVFFEVRREKYIYIVCFQIFIHISVNSILKYHYMLTGKCINFET